VIGGIFQTVQNGGTVCRQEKSPSLWEENGLQNGTDNFLTNHTLHPEQRRKDAAILVLLGLGFRQDHGFSRLVKIGGRNGR